MKCPICNKTVIVSTIIVTRGYTHGFKMVDKIYCGKCYISFVPYCIPNKIYFIDKAPYWKKRSKTYVCKVCDHYIADKKKCRFYDNQKPEDSCNQFRKNEKLIAAIKNKTVKYKKVICPECGGIGRHESWDSSSQTESWSKCYTCAGEKEILIFDK